MCGSKSDFYDCIIKMLMPKKLIREVINSDIQSNDNFMAICFLFITIDSWLREYCCMINMSEIQKYD